MEVIKQQCKAAGIIVIGDELKVINQTALQIQIFEGLKGACLDYSTAVQVLVNTMRSTIKINTIYFNILKPELKEINEQFFKSNKKNYKHKTIWERLNYEI